MKKFLAGLVVLFIFAVSVPWTVDAQTCGYRHRHRRSYAVKRYYPRYYAPRRYVSSYYPTGYAYRRPSIYQRHKHLIDIGIGTGAGALIGGLLRGRRGAGYGALIGAGSGLLYTTVLKPKRRVIYR